MDTRVSPAVVVVVLVLVAAILLAIWYYMNAAKPAAPSDVEIIPPPVDNPVVVPEVGEVPVQQPADTGNTGGEQQPAGESDTPVGTPSPSPDDSAAALTEPGLQPGG